MSEDDTLVLKSRIEELERDLLETQALLENERKSSEELKRLIAIYKFVMKP